MSLTNIGSIQGAMGDLEDSLRTHERALAYKEELYGGPHPEVAASLDSLAGAQRRLERPEAALANHERALAMRLELQGKEHPNLAYTYQGIGEACIDLERYDDAVAALRRALALRLDPDNSDPFERGETEFTLAKALWATGERDEARRLAEAARPRLARVAESEEAVIRWLASPPP
jgi:tetratricopeptide (TPR) repeat protein